MQTEPHSRRDNPSQDVRGSSGHPTAVSPLQRSVDRPSARSGGAGACDPANRAGKGFYQALSMSSVGLEFGISVAIGLLFGMFLDGKLGTEPWMMLLFLGIGFAAGFRGVFRAVNRSDRWARADGGGPRG